MYSTNEKPSMYSSPKNYTNPFYGFFWTNTREKLKYFELIWLFIEFQQIIVIKLSSALFLKLVNNLDSCIHKTWAELRSRIEDHDRLLSVLQCTCMQRSQWN